MNHSPFFSEAVERSHGKLSMPMEDEQAELQCAKEVCGMNTTMAKLGFLHNITLTTCNCYIIFSFCVHRSSSVYNQWSNQNWCLRYS